MSESNLSGAAWILEQLTLNNPTYERNAARRAFNEVQRAWVGDISELWWKWLNESANSLGLRCKTIDCTIEEAFEIAHDGAQLVTFKDDPEQEWLAVLSYTGKKYKLAHAKADTTITQDSANKFHALLESFSINGKLRCVVMEPNATNNLTAEPNQQLNPLDRLRRLLRPEWSDIWIVLIFAFIVGLLMLATPIAVESLVNTVAFGRFLQPVIVLSLMLLIFLGFLAAVRALQTFVVEIIQRRLFARVAADLAYRLPRTEVEATQGQYLPEVVNRFFDIVTVQKVSAQLLLDGIALVLNATIGMAVLAFYHPWLLGFDVILLASIAFIIFILGRGAVSSAIKESKHKYFMASWLEDITRAPSAFRNKGGAEFAMERADRYIHKYLAARKTHFKVLMRQIIFALGLQAVASTVLLGMGGWLVISGELTLGQLVAAELIVTTIVGAFAKLGKHMESFYDLLASVDKLGVLFDLPVEHQDGMLATNEEEAVAVDLIDVKYIVPKQPTLLEAVTIKIPADSSFALYGKSGSGKSTLFDLIYGLRTPTSGHLLLNGFDPRDMRPDILRSRVVLVRHSEIFQGSIAENVHMNREDISAADVRDALHHLGLLNAVLQFEEGTDTALLSNGVPLTDNQSRLLTLARAIVGKPGLLLIDGTLDGLSDDELTPVLDYLLSPERGWTLIIATGRKAIAERCNNQSTLYKESELLSA